MKVYVSGPMSGYHNLNRDSFFAAKVKLEQVGHTVVLPNFIDSVKSPEYAGYDAVVRRCISDMVLCDVIVLLENWEGSVGANREVDVARIVKMPIHEMSELVES